MIEQLGELATSKWLERLSPQAVENDPLPMTDILKNCCYAPACGFDLDVIDIAVGNVCSFVFIDERLTPAQINEQLSRLSAKGYKIIASKLIDYQAALLPNKKAPIVPVAIKEQAEVKGQEFTTVEEIINKYGDTETNRTHLPFLTFAQWLVLEKQSDRTKQRISVLILSSSIEHAYFSLFWSHGVAPGLINLNLDETTVGRFGEDSLFAKLISMQPQKVRPSFLMFYGNSTTKALRDFSWKKSHDAEVAGFQFNNKNYMIFKRAEDKFLWPIRILQVLPFNESESISAKQITLRLKKYFQLSLSNQQLSRNLDKLEQIDLISRVDDFESPNQGNWYRVTNIDINLNNTNQDGVIGLSILDKIGEKLLPRSFNEIHELVNQHRRRLAMITDNEQAETVAQRFSYSDIVFSQDVSDTVIKTLNTALLNNIAVTLLYKPLDEEYSQIDVGIPLGIVQWNSLQKLIIEIKNVRNEKTNDQQPLQPTIVKRIAIDRILKVHLRRHKGEFDVANLAKTHAIPNDKQEFWHNNYDPTYRFDQHLNETAGGMSSGNEKEKQLVKVIDIEFHVHVHLKTHLETSTFFENQKFELLEEHNYLFDEKHENENKWYRMTARVPHSRDLNHWILSWAERILVIEPGYLREQLHHRQLKAIENYERLKEKW